MTIAYLDCFAGIAGDMFLGALLDAGVPLRVLEESAYALNLGVSLRVSRVDRSGIMATKVYVMQGDQLAEDAAPPHEGMPQQEQRTHTRHPQTQHRHKGGHPHDRDLAGSYNVDTRHDDGHGRSLSQIRSIIESSSLASPVKRTAIRAFELLGASEAKIHGVDIETIHFHEVGAVDAIVDIVAASAGIHHLQIGKWYASPVNVGGGMVQCAHGVLPVPAPATADLLRGIPTYSAQVQKELVTPTGAVLLRVLDATFGPQPAMSVDRIGYGAGTRNPPGFPNVLRLCVGQDGPPATAQDDPTETVVVIETAVDDLSPQLIAHVAEQALARGALDVMLAPVLMKKGRPGTLITVLAHEGSVRTLQNLLLRETSTLGVRMRREARVTLERKFEIVSTEFGEVRMKLGLREGHVLNAAPEFEDCRAAAAAHNVAVKAVQQAAIAAWHRCASRDAERAAE